jgi:hypothetical protein
MHLLIEICSYALEYAVNHNNLKHFLLVIQGESGGTECIYT